MMILSVSYSPKSVCTKFIAAKTTLINQQFAANDLSTHHSKTATQWHYRTETIGRSDCRPIVRLSADTIVRWDYRPNPNCNALY